MPRFDLVINGERHLRVRELRIEGDNISGNVEGSTWGRTATVQIGAVDGDQAPASHDHSGFAAAGHTHDTAHTHDDLAPDGHAHDDLAAADHSHDTTHSHAGVADESHTHPEYATSHDHPYASSGHTHTISDNDIPASIARDSEVTGALAAHAETAHGLEAHALDGVYHTGAGVLPTQGQKNALAGTSGTPGTGNEYVTAQDSRLTDSRTPTAHTHSYAATSHAHAIADTTGLQAAIDGKAASSHTHADADLPAGIARDAEVTAAIATHAATPHGGSSAPVHADLAAGTTAMAFGTNDSVKVTPTANATYTTTVPVAGKRVTLIVLTSGTTSRTITFGAGFKSVSTLATGTATGRVFVVSWVSDGTNLYEASRTAAIVA